jgi:ATP-binding cassette subfamily B protein
VAALGVLLAATIAVRLTNPQLLRAFIDRATAGAPLSSLIWLAVVFIVAALTLQLVTLAEVYVAENVGLTATNWLRADLTLHVLRLDPPFHAAHTPGELIERTDGDVATLGNFFSRLVIQVAGNALLLLGILVLLLRIDLLVGAAAAVCAAAGMGIMLWLRRMAVPYFAAQRQASAELFGLIEERLAGTEDVRANGGVGYVLYRFLQRSRQHVWADLRARLAGSLTFQSGFLCLELATATTLAAGAWLYRRDALSIGTVYLVFAYTQSLYQPLNAIMRQLQEFQQAAASIGRVRQMLEERSAIVDGPGAAPPRGPLGVELDGVTFAYPPDERLGTKERVRPDEADASTDVRAPSAALRDVSLRVEPGQVLGLLGRTGSGKTTLGRLLFRLYDPQEGTIRLGDIDLRDAPVAALRDRIGVVTQEVQLFHATVRDNVTFFDRSIPDERIVAVLDELGLGVWWRSLPDGLETRLAPGGTSLSAGEGQLLAFARVFLKDPGLVILDEASSRLDPASERLLERAVDRLLGHSGAVGGNGHVRPGRSEVGRGDQPSARTRTAIVIAHRLATVERADRIAILEDGCVVEEGERAALAADPQSRFSRLLRTGLEEVLV